MNQTEFISSMFSGNTSDSGNRFIGDWSDSFKKHVNKFIALGRHRGYMCDLLGYQQIPNGLAALIQISQDGKYKEQFQIFYSGLDISHSFVK